MVPRIAAGEITPEGLITIGQVAKKCKRVTLILLMPMSSLLNTLV